MTEVVLHPLNVPVRFLSEENLWSENVISREAFDINGLNARVKTKPIVGEFNPTVFSEVVDSENVCLRITSFFISDGMVMGIVVPHGPKSNILQGMIDSRTPLTLTMRAKKEFDTSTQNPLRVKKVLDVIAFDLHLS